MKESISEVSDKKNKHVFIQDALKDMKIDYDEKFKNNDLLHYDMRQDINTNRTRINELQTESHKNKKQLEEHIKNLIMSFIICNTFMASIIILLLIKVFT